MALGDNEDSSMTAIKRACFTQGIVKVVARNSRRKGTVQVRELLAIEDGNRGLWPKTIFS